MTSTQTITIVLKDGTGSYFLVPQATLEQGKVPEEHTAELERIMAEAATLGGADEDAQGFFFPLLPFIVNPVTVAGGLAGYFGTQAAIEGEGGGGLNANDYAQQMAGIGLALQQQVGGSGR
jgi:hypothetical protein